MNRANLQRPAGAEPDGSAAAEPDAPAPVLWLLGCAAPPVLAFREIAAAAIAQGWQVCPILTPSAGRWLEAVPGELAQLSRLTGHLARTEFWMPGQGRPFPAADAVLVAPATANTVNKCAAGISDTLVLGLLNDAIGRGLPVALVTATGDDDRHPAFRRSVDLLRSAAVDVIGTPRRPGTPERRPLPWRQGLAALSQRRGELAGLPGSPLAGHRELGPEQVAPAAS